MIRWSRAGQEHLLSTRMIGEQVTAMYIYRAYSAIIMVNTREESWTHWCYLVTIEERGAGEKGQVY